VYILALTLYLIEYVQLHYKCLGGHNFPVWDISCRYASVSIAKKLWIVNQTYSISSRTMFSLVTMSVINVFRYWNTSIRNAMTFNVLKMLCPYHDTPQLVTNFTKDFPPKQNTTTTQQKSKHTNPCQALESNPVLWHWSLRRYLLATGTGQLCWL